MQLRFFFILCLCCLFLEGYSQFDTINVKQELVDTASVQSFNDSIYWYSLLTKSDFTVIQSVKKIDDWLFILFPYWTDKMVNPGSIKFNATDNGSGQRKRLFFAAKYENNWIVSYEHGGRGYHTHCFFIAVDNQNKIHISDVYLEFKTFEALKKSVISGRFPIKKWNKSDY